MLYFLSELLLILVVGTIVSNGSIFLDRNGCGKTKGCLFKPAGCDPQLDCSIGIIFYVSGPNKLTIQMLAQVLSPVPNLQYVAIGFSDDNVMGDDFVTECVVSPKLTTSSDSELYASYNNQEKTNDRTDLNATEHSLLYDELKAEVVDGFFKCQFVQTIVPQFKFKEEGKLRDLNKNYYIMAATGTSQPDEVNAHDTTIGSHNYPAISSNPITPASFGEQLYPLPQGMSNGSQSISLTSNYTSTEKDNTTNTKQEKLWENKAPTSGHAIQILSFFIPLFFYFCKI